MNTTYICGIKNSKGFSLVEVVMVITLIGIIAGVISMPLMEGVRGWVDVTTREDITQSGRVAMERMVREIRNTARKVNDEPCIDTANATTFAFGTDLANCGAVNFSRAGAAVPYRIQRNGVDLADNIQSLTFTYYDNNNGTPPASIADIRRVAIEIVSINDNETLRKYSEVYLPNMRGY